MVVFVGELSGFDDHNGASVLDAGTVPFRAAVSEPATDESVDELFTGATRRAVQVRDRECFPGYCRNHA
jgi:hypothetical protein